MIEIPYPPVFRDWRRESRDSRVATARGLAGVSVQMRPTTDPPHVWREVELTETDACLLAASLLQRAGRKKLSRKVLKALSA